MQFALKFLSGNLNCALQSNSRFNGSSFLGGWMRAMPFRLALFAAVLSLGVLASAQEGHPLKGSWAGDWGSTANQRNPLLIVMDFNGKITGTINPGTDNIAIRNGTLNPTGWVLRLEGEGKDKSGKTLNYVIEGRIENIAMYNRSIQGTWSNQTSKGDFKVTRQ
jgi:hypothetical protein